MKMLITSTLVLSHVNPKLVISSIFHFKNVNASPADEVVAPKLSPVDAPEAGVPNPPNPKMSDRMTVTTIPQQFRDDIKII